MRNKKAMYRVKSLLKPICPNPSWPFLFGLSRGRSYQKQALSGLLLLLAISYPGQAAGLAQPPRPTSLFFTAPAYPVFPQFIHRQDLT